MNGQVPLSIVLATVVALGALYGVGKKYGPDLRRFYRFLDAWEGYRGPDGKDIPGVLERLTRVEESATASASAVVAVERRVEHVSAQLDEVKLSQLAKAAELTQIRQAMDELRAQGTDAAHTHDTEEQQ